MVFTFFYSFFSPKCVSSIYGGRNRKKLDETCFFRDGYNRVSSGLNHQAEETAHQDFNAMSLAQFGQSMFILYRNYGLNEIFTGFSECVKLKTPNKSIGEYVK